MDNSSKVLQKVLKTVVVVVSGFLIFTIGAGSFYIYQTNKKVNNINKTYPTIDALFDRLNNISSLSTSDRIYINQQHATYLKNNFNDELTFDEATIEKKIMNNVTVNNAATKKNFTDQIRNSILYIRKSQYALTQYILGHPEAFLESIYESKLLKLYPNTQIQAAFELGLFDDCRKLLEQYKNTDNTFDNELVWTAIKVGLFDMATPDAPSTTPAPPMEGNKGELHTIYQAHALLMTGKREQALPLYRQQLRAYKDAIEKDFAVFRWLCFPDEDISLIEKELQLNRLNVYTNPNDETNTALVAPFIGKWQCEDNDTRINWEIKDNHNLCHYLFQTKNDGTNWIDDDIAVTRYRFKQTDNKTIIEEYNVRTNIVSATEVMQITDNELTIRDKDKSIKVFKRIKE